MPFDFDHAPPQDVWRAMSTDRDKIATYRHEADAVVGLRAAQQALGPGFPALLRRWAVLVIHPDLIAQRRIGRCLTFLRDHDFEPLVAVPFVFEPRMTAEMWKHSLEGATEDSLTVCDVFCAKTESLLLMLADRGAGSEVPASVRLSALKGSTLAAKRHSGHLRSHLEATNRIVTAVHCSDEPIDIVRELAILLPGREVELLRRAEAMDRRAVPPDVDGPVADIYARTPPYDVNVARAAERLLSAGLSAPGRDRARAAQLRLRGNLQRWRDGDGFLVWKEFVADLSDLGMAAESWDALLVASEFVQHSRDAAQT